LLEGLAIADDHQSGSGHGVDRLDAAAVHDRDLAELMQPHFPGAIFRRRHGHNQVEDSRSGGEPGHETRKAAHQANLRRRNPASRRLKWINMPAETRAQEMYGISQPGLRTTCRTVPRSFRKNPD